MCDFCFMKSLVLNFTHLRSLFSLIDCWLILSRVISLTPLDLLSLFLLSLRGSRSLRPDTQSLRTVWILRPRGRILRIINFSYIYCEGVGVKPTSSRFHRRRLLLSSPHLISRPSGDFDLPTIKNSSILEGRLSSCPETPRRLWI